MIQFISGLWAQQWHRGCAFFLLFINLFRLLSFTVHRHTDTKVYFVCRANQNFCTYISTLVFNILIMDHLYISSNSFFLFCFPFLRQARVYVCVNICVLYVYVHLHKVYHSCCCNTLISPCEINVLNPLFNDPWQVRDASLVRITVSANHLYKKTQGIHQSQEQDKQQLF